MLELRLLQDSDIPLIEVWLNQDHVKKWYEIPALSISIDDWVEEIRAYQGEFKWITYCIVLNQGRPIGLCLYYKCADSEGEDFGTMPLEGAYGIDYLIGEKSLIGKGFGKEMLTMLKDKIFSLPDALLMTADIDLDNEASKRVLISCGFSLLNGADSRYILKKDKL